MPLGAAVKLDPRGLLLGDLTSPLMDRVVGRTAHDPRANGDSAVSPRDTRELVLGPVDHPRVLFHPICSAHAVLFTVGTAGHVELAHSF